jgi:uncharacterized repeat protein (TIGR03803 family)
MRRSIPAEVIAVHRPARRVNSYVKGIILAAAVVLLAGALASAQTVSTLYNFVGGKTSGANPWYVTLVQGTNGELYGTTYNGGSKGMGTFFELTTSGTFTLLHSFVGGASDGAKTLRAGSRSAPTEISTAPRSRAAPDSQGVCVQDHHCRRDHSAAQLQTPSQTAAFPVGAADRGDGWEFLWDDQRRQGARMGWFTKSPRSSGAYYDYLYFHLPPRGNYPIAPPTQGTDGVFVYSGFAGRGSMSAGRW